MKASNVAIMLFAAVVLIAVRPVPTALAAETAITGLVSFAGSPIADTEVGWFDPTTGATGEGHSGSDGRYSLTVPDGHPFVIYAGIDHTATGRWLPLGADRFVGVFVGASGVDYLYQSLTPFANATTVDVALSAPGTVLGKTAGLAGQKVRLLTLTGNTVRTVRASTTGRYEFSGLVPGRYRVAAFAPLERFETYESNTLFITAGGVRRLNPRLVKTGTVTGVVRRAGKPVKGVRVSVANVGAENATETDARGRYLVKGVPEGPVAVWFSGQGTPPTGDYVYDVYEKHATATVSSGRTQHLDATIPRPAVLAVWITPTKRAKNFTLSLVDTDGVATVHHYVRVGSAKTRIPVVLPGIKAGTYTMVVTDDRKTRYAKKEVTLSYGSTTSLGSIALTRKTLTITGAISGSEPVAVSFENRFGVSFDSSPSDNRYSITGLIPGKGTVHVDEGPRSAPTPYSTADNWYSLQLTTTTRLDVAYGGPQLGLFTGILAVGSLPVGTSASLSGTSRHIPQAPTDYYFLNRADVVNGYILGSAELEGPATYVLDYQYTGWTKEFVAGGPFWLELADGSITVTTARGTTTDIGTIQLVVRR